MKNRICSFIMACVLLSITILGLSACKEKTITADFSNISYTVTFKYENNYGGTFTSPTYKYTSAKVGEEVTMADPGVRAGYYFKGWTDGTNIYTLDDTMIMPAHSVTLTPTWGKYIFEEFIPNNTDTPIADPN